jgi:hypothetical protein
MIVLGSQGNLYWYEGNVKFKSMGLKQDHQSHVPYLSFLNKMGIFYALSSYNIPVAGNGSGNKSCLQPCM